jgi:hypothetical protein
MSSSDAVLYLATAILIAGVIFVPRWISARRRLSLGLVVFVAAWVGILAALLFDELPLLRSETVAYGWMALCGLALLKGLLFLVTASSTGWALTVRVTNGGSFRRSANVRFGWKADISVRSHENKSALTFWSRRQRPIQARTARYAPNRTCVNIGLPILSCDAMAPPM